MPPEMDPQKSHFLTNPKKWSPHHRWVPPQSPLRLHRGLRRRRRRLIGKIIDENIVRIIILSKIFFLILPCKSFFFPLLASFFFLRSSISKKRRFAMRVTGFVQVFLMQG
ncbi:hypothetical protein Droror1_Dr00005670 [Drosera rotundifolia]